MTFKLSTLNYAKNGCTSVTRAIMLSIGNYVLRTPPAVVSCDKTFEWEGNLTKEGGTKTMSLLFKILESPCSSPTFRSSNKFSVI